MRGSREGLVARYLSRPGRPQRRGWHEGPANSIDRLIDFGHSAIEISYELDVPRWLVVERFEQRAGMAA